MVFFRKEMQRSVMVHPQYLGPNLRSYVKDLLIADVEGMSLDNAGFIMTVLHVDEPGMMNGLIDHLTGFVKYNIGYTALMFRPFKNEVLDATVRAVSDVRMAIKNGSAHLAQMQCADRSHSRCKWMTTVHNTVARFVSLVCDAGWVFCRGGATICVC